MALVHYVLLELQRVISPVLCIILLERDLLELLLAAEALVRRLSAALAMIRLLHLLAHLFLVWITFHVVV